MEEQGRGRGGSLTRAHHGRHSLSNAYVRYVSRKRLLLGVSDWFCLLHLIFHFLVIFLSNEVSLFFYPLPSWVVVSYVVLLDLHKIAMCSSIIDGESATENKKKR